MCEDTEGTTEGTGVFVSLRKTEWGCQRSLQPCECSCKKWRT